MLNTFFKDNKYNFYALLIYSVSFPFYIIHITVGLHFFNFFIYSLHFPDITFLTVIVLLILSIKQDKNKKASIGTLLFLLLYFAIFFIFKIVIMGDKTDRVSILNGFGNPIAYLPILYFIFYILYASLKPNYHQPISQQNPKLQKITKYLLLTNIGIFFLGIFINISLELLGQNFEFSNIGIMGLINALLTILGIILSLVLVIKYKKFIGLLLLNILLAAIIYGIFNFILSVGEISP